MSYLLHILVMINIYAILALSLNIAVGYTGLISLCHAAFYGIGAYITTLIMINVGLSFFPALLFAAIGSLILGLIISLPSLRVRGDFFILSTLGFQIIVFVILYNWTGLTRGAFGIAGIPRPEIFGWQIITLRDFFILTQIIAMICAFLIYLLMNSPFGRALKSIREDEVAALALGKNVLKFKTQSFLIAAVFATIPGALFATYMRYIDPSSFTLMESIFILSIIIIGGTGNIKGPVMGAIFLVMLPEFLRFLQIPDSIAANMRQVIYGFLMILVLRFRPQGIWGEYKFQ